MNILLVDDDEVSRMALVALCQRIAGVTQVAEAHHGEDAWRQLQAGLRPDLCCCDLVMPELDGMGLLKRARADTLFAHLPFLMISSAADRQSVTAAAHEGVSGFIVKPYAAGVVGRTVEKVLRESRLRREEAAGETRRRLGISQQELQRLTQRLREDVAGTLQTLKQAETNAERLATLRRLKGASAMLGLHRCTDLLQRGTDEGTPEAMQPVLLQEVLLLIDARIQAIG